MIVEILIAHLDIASGRPFDPSCCPVAKAIGRHVNAKVMVGGCTFDLIRADGEYQYSIPLALEASAFRLRFDQGHHVEELKFQQEIPDMFLKDEYRNTNVSTAGAAEAPLPQPVSS